jgi:Ca2+-binding RTX toxin-like protein
MRRPIFVGFLLATIALAIPAATSAAPPLCFGKRATIVLHGGEGRIHGTTGDDVVIGSHGDDEIDLMQELGADLVCGRGGDDFITVSDPNSKADGGPGQDFIESVYGLALGGSGDDPHVEAYLGGRAEGGSGSDVVLTYGGDAVGDGGSGDDTVCGSHAAFLFGGAGSDSITSTSILMVDCGSGYDQLQELGTDEIKRCEVIDHL